MNQSQTRPRLNSFPFHSCHLLCLVLIALILAAGQQARSQGTKLWTQSRFEEFEKGSPQGVAITSDGKLRTGPVAKELLTTPSTFVWAIAANDDASGPIYAATGAPATVLRLTPDGKGSFRQEKLFETKALAVQSLVKGPDGNLYAATIPDGRVYRIKPDQANPTDESNTEIVFDLGKAVAAEKKDNTSSSDTKRSEIRPDKNENKSRYIWDLSFDKSGKLYIATGGPGVIYRINVAEQQPTPQAFFKSDEQHIRVLAWDKDGNLLAGSDGSGLVYRISPDGQGYVLFSAPRREVTALAVAPDGTIYAADVGDKSRNPLPPLQVQQGMSSITISFVQPGSMQAANASTALPEGTEIFALKSGQAPRKMWSGKDEIVYKLSSSADGLTALTGNRGRLFTIHPDGSFTDIAHLDAQQAVSMTALAGGWLIGTANTGKVYGLADPRSPARSALQRYAEFPETHTFASDVLDAGATARWGRVEVDPDSHGYVILTRSGNVEQPVRNARDWGWSDWQPAANGKVASPPGRYLQWKISLNTTDSEVSGVGINFLDINAAPAVDDLIVVPGARFTPQPPQPGQAPTISIAFPNAGQSGAVAFDPNAGAATSPIQAQKDRTAVTVRWTAHDDNGDDLKYDLYIRGDGETVWRPLKKNLTDKVYSFDGASLPDGGYQVRVVATDAPSHSPGESLTGELKSERFELDTTPPVLSALQAGTPVSPACKAAPCESTVTVPITFDAADATSPITKAEYSVDAGPWQYIEPVGELSDARQEHYSVNVPLKLRGVDADGQSTTPARSPDSASEHLITVRAYDRHDNVATGKVIVPPFAAPGTPSAAAPAAKKR